MSEVKSDELRILELAIKTLSTSFDDFIGVCMDANGKSVAPPMKELMKARACLPPHCLNAFQPKEKK